MRLFAIVLSHGLLAPLVALLQANGELRYAPRDGTRVSFGADLNGANILDLRSAFTTSFATLQLERRFGS